MGEHRKSSWATAEVAERFDTELVGWFTTVNPHGQPQSSAVWFVIDDDDIVVYSRPDATRLTNLAHNDRIAFNLRGDATGDGITTLEGRAVIDATFPTPAGCPEYVAKYREEIVRLGWTVESYDTDFSMPLRISVDRVRAW